MKREEYNKYRSIKSDLHKWFDKWEMSKNGTRLTIDIEEYSPELRQALDKLYRDYGFYPYGLCRSYEFTNMNARVIYISFDSEEEWTRLSTIVERSVYENALFEGFNFDVCRFRYNVRTWEAPITSDELQEAAEAVDELQEAAEMTNNRIELTKKAYTAYWHKAFDPVLISELQEAAAMEAEKGNMIFSSHFSDLSKELEAFKPAAA